MVVLHTAIAIAVIVLLIIKAKVDPVISLIIGSLYLGHRDRCRPHRDPDSDRRWLRRDHGRGRPAHRLRRAHRGDAPCDGRLQEDGDDARQRCRRAPAPVRADGCDVDDLPLDLRGRAGRSGIPGGAFDRALHRPDRLAAHGRRARGRDLRRLRLRDPGTGRGLHRRPAGDPTRHLAAVRPRARAVDRDRDDIDLPVAPARPATGTRPRTKMSTRRWSSRRPRSWSRTTPRRPRCLSACSRSWSRW